MIACFLSNISAKYYKNPSMLSRVIAKNIGDVFLRHSVQIIDVKCSKKNKQDVQLLQRNRPAGCFIVLAKSGILELGDNILRTLYSTTVI